MILGDSPTHFHTLEAKNHPDAWANPPKLYMAPPIANALYPCGQPPVSILKPTCLFSTVRVTIKLDPLPSFTLSRKPASGNGQLQLLKKHLALK